MFDRKKYLLNWWDKTKIGIGIICIILVLVQLTAASKMIAENNTTVDFIEPQHYTSLSYGEEMAGEMKKDDMIMSFTASGEDLQYYLVKVNSENVIVMKTFSGSECDIAVSQMMAGQRDSIQYKGRVNFLTETDSAQLNLEVLTGDVLYQHGLTRNLNDILIRQCIDITLYEAFAETKYIIATIVGAFLMLAAAAWAFWKPFQKIGLQYGARMGRVDLGLMTKDDLSVEQGWFTEDNAKEQLTETEKYQPMRAIDPNPASVDFYQSGVNDEGNFYIPKSEEPEIIHEEDGSEFRHEHKNY